MASALTGLSANSQAILDALNQSARVRLNTLTSKETALGKQKTAVEGLGKELKDIADDKDVVKGSTDFDSLKSAVVEFVKQYNEANAALRGATGKDAQFATDSGVKSVLRRMDSSVRSTDGGNLRELGISIQKDGSLKLDETKFKDLATTDFAGAKSKALGAITRISSFADKMTSGTEGLAGVQNRFETSISRTAIEKTREQDRVTKAEQRNRVQLAALDKAMADILNTSYSLGSLINITT